MYLFNKATILSMEQNHLPVMADKIYSLVRVVYLTLRKRISKKKLFLDLNIIMKRGKIAGKALHNLMFHHHWAAFVANRRSHDSRHLSYPAGPPPGEYEFSCSNSPAPFSLFSFHKKHYSDNHQDSDGLDMMAFDAAVVRAMEIIHSETASPALPGFGRTPVVRQLRVTDSPFPVNSVDENKHVDEAAEQFISRFYNDLRRETS